MSYLGSVLGSATPAEREAYVNYATRFKDQISYGSLTDEQQEWVDCYCRELPTEEIWGMLGTLEQKAVLCDCECQTSEEAVACDEEKRGEQ